MLLWSKRDYKKIKIHPRTHPEHANMDLQGNLNGEYWEKIILYNTLIESHSTIIIRYLR